MAKADDSIWKRWEVMALLFIIIIALVIASGYATYGALSSLQDPADAGLSVKVGDQISVNYIGMFEDGTVFDTSIQSVAENNTLYPKSLSFSSMAPYSPLDFTVGAGQMIEGFDNGVIGMGINQTKVVTIPPDEGYGDANDDLIETRSLTETFPIYEWITNSTNFESMYYVPAIVGTTVKSNNYGWNMTVYHIDTIGGDILMKHEPMMNEIVDLYDGWDSMVISIDSAADQGNGEIVVKHLLYPDDEGEILASDDNGQFLVTDIDLDAGEMTVDYNREVVGKTLVFKIIVVSITPGEA